MGLLDKLPLVRRWPLVRQLASGDVAGLGDSACSARTDALRVAVFLAGKASARDPRATFRQQRDALARAGAPGPEAAAR